MPRARGPASRLRMRAPCRGAAAAPPSWRARAARVATGTLQFIALRARGQGCARRTAWTCSAARRTWTMRSLQRCAAPRPASSWHTACRGPCALPCGRRSAERQRAHCCAGCQQGRGRCAAGPAHTTHACCTHARTPRAPVSLARALPRGRCLASRAPSTPSCPSGGSRWPRRPWACSDCGGLAAHAPDRPRCARMRLGGCRVRPAPCGWRAAPAAGAPSLQHAIHCPGQP